MSSLHCSAVVHGKGEGRGAVAQQTGLPATGEAHGKSRDLKDTRNTEDPSHFSDAFSPDLHLIRSVEFAFIRPQSPSCSICLFFRISTFLTGHFH